MQTGNSGEQPKKLLLERGDFTTTVNANGYTIKYKGHSIGGATRMGKNTNTGADLERDRAGYSIMADHNIESLLKGEGPGYMREIIEKIDGV